MVESPVTNTLALGNLDLRPVKVPECAACHSRDVTQVSIPWSEDQKAINAFVRARASRLGIRLEDYDVAIDKNTGAVTATLKPTTEIEINFT